MKPVEVRGYVVEFVGGSAHDRRDVGMLTIEPPPARSNSWRPYLMLRNVPDSATRGMPSNSSSPYSSIGFIAAAI
jgi:hypothetical protein